MMSSASRKIFETFSTTVYQLQVPTAKLSPRALHRLVLQIFETFSMAVFPYVYIVTPATANHPKHRTSTVWLRSATALNDLVRLVGGVIRSLKVAERTFQIRPTEPCTRPIVANSGKHGESMRRGKAKRMYLAKTNQQLGTSLT